MQQRMQGTVRTVRGATLPTVRRGALASAVASASAAHSPWPSPYGGRLRTVRTVGGLLSRPAPEAVERSIRNLERSTKRKELES